MSNVQYILLLHHFRATGLVWAYWMPLATIAVNFGKLRSIISDCAKEACFFKCRENNQVGQEP